VRVSGVLVGLAMLLTACGSVPPAASSATESPSPMLSESPTAASSPLVIAAPTFHAGEVGLAYSPVTITANGGTTPYYWMLGSGSLPGGVNISPDGIISGTPTSSGAFKFTVAVNDTAQTSTSVPGTINIAARLTLRYVGDMALHGGVGVCSVPSSAHCPSTADNRYAPFAAVSGGAAPYSYSVLAGTPVGNIPNPWLGSWDGFQVGPQLDGVPPGTRLNGLALAGTFPEGAEASYRFTVAATDSLGVTTTIVAEYVLWYHHNLT